MQRAAPAASRLRRVSRGVVPWRTPMVRTTSLHIWVQRVSLAEGRPRGARRCPAEHNAWRRRSGQTRGVEYRQFAIYRRKQEDYEDVELLSDYCPFARLTAPIAVRLVLWFGSRASDIGTEVAHEQSSAGEPFWVLRGRSGARPCRRHPRLCQGGSAADGARPALIRTAHRKDSQELLSGRQSRRPIRQHLCRLPPLADLLSRSHGRPHPALRTARCAIRWRHRLGGLHRRVRRTRSPTFG